MVITTPNWLQFTGHQPKRKRAELACTLCHSKKIRCDLQVRTGQGLSSCSNCESAGKDCHVRPSKRSHRRVNRRPSPDQTDETPASAPAAPADPVTATDPPQPVNQPVGQLPREEWIWSFDDSPHPSAPANAPDPPSDAPTHPPLPPAPAPVPAPVTQTQPPHLPSESPATCRTDDTEAYRADTLSSRYYELEIQADARSQEQRELLSKRQLQLQNLPQLPNPDLQQSFVETYLEYCAAWCPVLDREQLTSDSPLLVNALAVVGSHIQPPVIPHDGPAAYYDRARRLFYHDEEPDVMRALQAVSLFYWWSPRPPSILHRHSSWWWTSVVIRHCQQLGVHRQPSLFPGPASSQHNHPPDHRSHLIRRRIWWTAFARERLTAICQAKPCIIDPDDCDIAEPSLDDFPDLSTPAERTRAEVFIHWVRLCGIIGRIAKHLSRPPPPSSTTTPGGGPGEGEGEGVEFPTPLARELINWVHSLPPHLQLPIHANRTTTFNRDIHQLHLPYLAVIIMLHLKRPYQPHHPEAYPPAILAASCVARILRDTLARGSTRFLMAITGWYCGMAFIALLQACRVDGLAGAANEDLDILTLAVDQLRGMWPTANIFHTGFQRLRPSAAAALLSLSNTHHQAGPPLTSHSQAQTIPPSIPSVQAGSVSGDGTGGGPGTGSGGVERNAGGIDWMEYFPFVSAQTSGIAERLLVPHTDEMFLEDVFPDTMMQFQDLFTNYSFDDMFL